MPVWDFGGKYVDSWLILPYRFGVANITKPSNLSASLYFQFFFHHLKSLEVTWNRPQKWGWPKFHMFHMFHPFPLCPLMVWRCETFVKLWGCSRSINSSLRVWKKTRSCSSSEQSPRGPAASLRCPKNRRLCLKSTPKQTLADFMMILPGFIDLPPKVSCHLEAFQKKLTSITS